MDNSAALSKDDPKVNREIVMEESVQEPVRSAINEESEASEAEAEAISEVAAISEASEVEEDVPEESYDENVPLQRESSVQIAPTGESSMDANNPMLYIQLGDRVVIYSTKYGRTIGTVYYRSYDRISIKPDGVSNMLHHFEMTEVDEIEVYKEEDGVTSAMVIEKRIYESFVEQQDFRKGQIIDTFDTDGARANSYTIVAIKREVQLTPLQPVRISRFFSFCGNISCPVQQQEVDTPQVRSEPS